MNPERWRQIDKLFQAALDRVPEERAVFISAACGGDDSLRREVEALLSADGQAVKLIESPAYAVVAPLLVESAMQSLLGKTLGRYQINSLIGKGGMGEVYQARDVRLDRIVALKLLPAEVAADKERMRRFIREAKAASALNHPNVAHIYEIGEEGSLSFIAMEYVEGQTLADRINGQPVSINEAIKIGIQIADALDEAHRKGITHRDIKPANVMLNERGQVKVLDFGLAKVAQPAAQSISSDISTMAKTAPGVVMGTVPYMSPEQAVGDDVDHRSDIFSLGVLLYEMLAGRRPFAGATVSETIAAILRDEPPSLSDHLPGVSRELAKIISRALRKDREDRYQAAKDLLLDLQSIQQESRTAGSFAAVDRGATQPRLFTSRLMTTLAVLLALLVAGGILWWYFWRGTPPPSIERSFPLTSDPGFEINPALSPDGKQVAFAWNGRQQDNFDIYIKLVGSNSTLQLTKNPAEDLSPAWSPDGRSIAFLRRQDVNRNELLLIPALGGPERKLAETVIVDERQFRLSALAWSPDGRWLAVSHREAGDQGEGLYLISTQTGEQRRLTRPPANYSRDFTPAFSPDGRALLFSRVSGPARTAAIYLLSLSADYTPVGEARLLKTDETFIASPLWTPDGRHVIYLAAASIGGREQTELRQLAVFSAGRSERVLLLEGEINELSLGRHLVYTHHNQVTDIWRAEVPPAGQPPSHPQLFISSTRWDAKPLYSPDGKKIAFGTTRSGAWEIWLADADGANPQQLTYFGGPFVGFMGWSPDSQRLVFHARPEGQADLFTISIAGGAPQRLTADLSDEVSPCYSHDGRWIYFTSMRSGQPEIWKMPVEGGGPIKLTSVGGWHPIESRDGKTVYFAPLRREQGVWKVPVEGGAATQVTGALSGLFAFDVGAQGIFYSPATEAGQKYSIRFLSFATGQSRTVVISEHPIDEDLAISPDQRFLAFVLHNKRDDDLILIENFVVR